MTEHHRTSLTVPADHPLIAIPMDVDGHEVVRYVVSEAEADAALSEGDVQAALGAVGALAHLDWDEMADALDRIRHDSPPSAPYIAQDHTYDP